MHFIVQPNQPFCVSGAISILGLQPSTSTKYMTAKNNPRSIFQNPSSGARSALGRHWRRREGSKKVSFCQHRSRRNGDLGPTDTLPRGCGSPCMEVACVTHILNLLILEDVEISPVGSLNKSHPCIHPFDLFLHYFQYDTRSHRECFCLKLASCE